jgi:hypothetical protein
VELVEHYTLFDLSIILCGLEFYGDVVAKKLKEKLLGRFYWY